MNAPTFTAKGSKSTTAAKLDKSVFEAMPESHDLLKQAYLSHDANTRQNLARTKTRGLVSGGGKKPWKQKGTGRARFGSSRVPIWRGGGIVFGPTGNENYTIKLHKQAKKTSVRQALSLKAGAGKILVVENFVFKAAKTSEAAALLTNIKATGAVVVVLETVKPELVRPFANLANVQVISAAYIDAYTVLNADTLVFTSNSLKAIENRLKKTLAKEGDK